MAKHYLKTEIPENIREDTYIETSKNEGRSIIGFRNLDGSPLIEDDFEYRLNYAPYSTAEFSIKEDFGIFITGYWTWKEAVKGHKAIVDLIMNHPDLYSKMDDDELEDIALCRQKAE